VELFGLTLVAVVGFALAYGVALPGLGHAVRWLGVHGPGGGILRDAQKFIAPLALLLAVSFGHGVEGVLARAGQASWRSLAGVGAGGPSGRPGPHPCLGGVEPLVRERLPR